MNVKLIALGNVLMKDDGVAIEVAKNIEEELIKRGVEVVCGETDFTYCISKVENHDFIFILDAAFYGKDPGEVTVMSLECFDSKKNGYSQHDYSFLDLLKLYYPCVSGEILGIEINEITFGFGLSSILQEKIKDISKEVLYKIYKILREKRVDLFL